MNKICKDEFAREGKTVANKLREETVQTNRESIRWLYRPGISCVDCSLTLIGLCLYTLVVVTYNLNIAWFGIVLGIIGLLFGRGRVQVPLPIWVYVLFLIWAFLCSFKSQFQNVALGEVIEQSKLLVIMLITVNALKSEGQLRFYLLFFLFCFVITPVRSALVNYVSGYTLFGRAIAGSIYANPNYLAALSLIALGVSLGVQMTKSAQTSLRIGAWFSSALLLVTILLTQSRGAFLGLVVAMGPAFLRFIFKRKGFLVWAVIALFVIWFAVPVHVWDRLSGIKKLTSVSTIGAADPEGSAAERFEIQKAAWRIFLDHPVFGVGLGVYGLANARYAPHIGYRDTHNTYLKLAAEVGMIGLVLWCVFVGSTLFYASRMRRRAHETDLASQQYWMEAGFIGYLVAGIFSSFSTIAFPYLIIAALWCSGNLLEYLSERGPQKSNRF